MRLFVAIVVLNFVLTVNPAVARTASMCNRVIDHGQADSESVRNCKLGLAILERFHRPGITIQAPKTDADFFAGECVIDPSGSNWFHGYAYNAVVLVKKENEVSGFDVFDSPLSTVEGKRELDDLETYLKRGEIRLGFLQRYGLEKGYKRIGGISVGADNSIQYSLRFSNRVPDGFINRRTLKRNADDVYVLRIENPKPFGVQEALYCLLKKVVPDESN